MHCHYNDTDHLPTCSSLSDINECLQPNACGVNTNCINLPGNYTCQCKDGYIGTNPYDGCADLDECADPNSCGPGAICTNLEGSYRCDCPEGFVGDPHTVLGCTDLDECTTPNSRGVAPCGRNALCHNEVGSFKCACPEGYIGDPTVDCQGKCHSWGLFSMPIKTKHDICNISLIQKHHYSLDLGNDA